MTRLFVQPVPEGADSVRLTREDSHYLKDVLRMQVGDAVILFDGSGTEYRSTIRELRSSVTLSIVERTRSEVRPGKRLIIAQGLLKGEKMDLLIRKAAEMGVTTVVPVITGRSQVRTTAKVPRWRKIAGEASQQCRRTDVLNVSDAVSLDEFSSSLPDSHPEALKIVFYESGQGGLSILEQKVRDAKEVVVLVGPEGGFSGDEIDLIKKGGFIVVNLGEMIMRADTAAIVCSGIIQYLGGQYG